MKLCLLGFSALLIAGPLIAVPDDLENAFQALKEAEAKNDAAQVKRVATEACALARQVIATPAPQDDATKAAWSERLAQARALELRTEYALYSTAVQASPAATVELLSTLEQQNPKSKYLDDGYGRYLLALSQKGAAKDVPAVAEKAITNFPENEDLLLVLADAAINRKQSDRAAGYADRLVAVLAKHPKPEYMAASDWERKRRVMLGRGYWIAGIVRAEKNRYYEADKNLRAALPLIKGDDAMAAAALFNLGVANYQLGKTLLNKAQVMEAVKFSEQAAAIAGPHQEQAWRNAIIMKGEAAKMR